MTNSQMISADTAGTELARRRALVSANSINIARLLPQSFYHAHAALALEAVARDERRRRFERRFKSIVYTASDLMFITDVHGVITWCGPSVERLSGFRSEELCDTHLASYAHPDDLAIIEKFVTAVLRADASALRIGSGTVTRIGATLPFGKRVGSHAANVRLYPRFLAEFDRVLTPDGRAVFGGTYFPDEQRGGMIRVPHLCRPTHRLWRAPRGGGAVWQAGGGRAGVRRTGGPGPAPTRPGGGRRDPGPGARQAARS